mgnify:FL=1
MGPRWGIAPLSTLFLASSRFNPFLFSLLLSSSLLLIDTHPPTPHQELADKPDVQYVPGGATQNTIRVAQWMLKDTAPGESKVSVFFLLFHFVIFHNSEKDPTKLIFSPSSSPSLFFSPPLSIYQAPPPTWAPWATTSTPRS